MPLEHQKLFQAVTWRTVSYDFLCTLRQPACTEREQPHQRRRGPSNRLVGPLALGLDGIVKLSCAGACSRIISLQTRSPSSPKRVLLQLLALVVRHLRDGISFPLRRHLGTV